MLLTPHTLVGLAIAKQIPNPFLSAPLALLSHFVLDSIPHWDFFTNGHDLYRWRKWSIALDFTLGLFFGLFFIFQSLPNQTQAFNYGLCAFMACLPDGMEAPKVLFDKEWRLSNMILAFQHRIHFRAQLPWGAIPQLILIGLSLIFLFR